MGRDYANTEMTQYYDAETGKLRNESDDSLVNPGPEPYRPMAEIINDAVRTFPKGTEEPDWVTSLRLYRVHRKAPNESKYAGTIRIAPSYRPEYDVRHIEAYMRLEHPTLDGMIIWDFVEEVKLAIAAIDAGGVEQAEALAQSFGFMLPTEWER